MEYGEWVKTVPAEITSDPLWKMQVYRMALYAADIGWKDVTRLAADTRTVPTSGQLHRALGSISSNFAEGYSRGGGKDRARFYEYSLGSCRESRDWYYKARHVLGDEVVEARMRLHAQIIKQLLVIIPNERDNYVREELGEYTTDSPIRITNDPAAS